MIVTEFYNGQGLGNQLWCYLVTRIISNENGYDFGIQSPQKFKGKDFLKIDFGLTVVGGSGPEGGPPDNLPLEIDNYYKESSTHHNSIDISKKDLKLLKVSDRTKIDGVMQSVSYIDKHRELIKKWLIVTRDFDKSTIDSKDICIIHIRGGDFVYSSAFLDKSYYDNAIKKMLEHNDKMNFFIITDDVNYATRIYPDIKIIGGSSQNASDNHKAQHHIGGPIWVDWLILLNCRNIILSASSFSFIPTYLNDDVYVIAPMYWADYNRSDGYWSRNDMIVDGWNYLNRTNDLKNSITCSNELLEYESKNPLWN